MTFGHIKPSLFVDPSRSKKQIKNCFFKREKESDTMRLLFIFWFRVVGSFVPRKNQLSSDSYSAYIQELFKVDSYQYFDSSEIGPDLGTEIELSEETTTSIGPKGLPKTTKETIVNLDIECGTSICQENRNGNEPPVIKIIGKFTESRTLSPSSFEEMTNFNTEFGTKIPEHPDPAGIGSLVLKIFCGLIVFIFVILLIMGIYYIIKNWSTRLVPLRIRLGMVI